MSSMFRSLFGMAAIFGHGQSGPPTLEDAFAQYKHEFHRKYADDSDEHRLRYQSFKRAYSQVHSLDDAPVLGGEFQFDEYSDATEDEFLHQRLGYTLDNKTEMKMMPPSLRAGVDSQVMAGSIDWVSLGAVTPVKDQSSCGSCWAFTAIGTLEGAVAVATRTLLDLSEEQLLDCDRYAASCRGENMAIALLWSRSVGLCTERQYPYAYGSVSGCQNSRCNALPAGCVSAVYSARGESGLAQAVSGRPVSVGLWGDALAGYRSGIVWTRSAVSRNMLNHGVVVVGYTPDYWRIKNSWGKGWGEGGYARIRRESSTSFPSYYPMPYQGPYGPFGMYADAAFPAISSSCRVNPYGVSDQNDLWRRVFDSAFFWPVLLATICLSCLTVAAAAFYLRSRGRKARQLRNVEQGSGVSMLGF